MAFIVGVGLCLVVEMVLSLRLRDEGVTTTRCTGGRSPTASIYMVYLVATALLGFKVGWSLPRWSVMLAGCVPLSFWVERKVARGRAQMATTGSVSA